MLIRKATFNDSEVIARQMLDVMEDLIYVFIGSRDPVKAAEFMSYLVKTEANQYSYQNCWVAEEEGRVVGVVNVYDGAQLAELRKPVIEYVRDRHKRDFAHGDETGAGEFYLDTLSVEQQYRCRGIGSGILQFVIDDFVHRQGKVLGLLVDQENPDAKRLYLRLGFEVVGSKSLFGKNLEHLQMKAKRQ